MPLLRLRSLPQRLAPCYVGTKTAEGCAYRRIAKRLTALCRYAIEEGERINAASVKQFAEFFISHDQLGMLKITLTPDGTLRARWIAGPGNFTAIEFTGRSLVKLVAAIPCGSQTAQYFGSELDSSVVRFARDLGASFV